MQRAYQIHLERIRDHDLEHQDTSLSTTTIQVLKPDKLVEFVTLLKLTTALFEAFGIGINENTTSSLIPRKQSPPILI